MLTRPLTLWFNTDPEAGGTPPENPAPTPAPTPDPAPSEPSFPANTSVQDMTPEQQAAYWKFHSRKHERDAREARDAAEELRKKNLTDEEKRIEEVRRQGELTGAGKFLGDAVHGHLRALTGKSDEDVSSALAFVDTAKFLAADGSLDRDRVKAFAESLGTAAPAAPAAPTPPVGVQALLAGTIQRPNDRTGGSINATRQELRKQYGGKQ